MGDAGNAVNAVLSDAGNKVNEIGSDAERKTKKALSGTAGFAAVAGETAGDFATGGARSLVQDELDRANPVKQAKDAAEEAAKTAEQEQIKAEEELKKNAAVADQTAENAKARSRQKKLAAKRTGRAGTILTSPLGNVASADQAPLKTLLGS